MPFPSHELIKIIQEQKFQLPLAAKLLTQTSSLICFPKLVCICTLEWIHISQNKHKFSADIWDIKQLFI